MYFLFYFENKIFWDILQIRNFNIKIRIIIVIIYNKHRFLIPFIFLGFLSFVL